jgi:hypothetical protein
LVVLGGSFALAAPPKPATAGAPPAAFAPVRWATNADDPGARPLAQAARDLLDVRVEMARLLEQRIAADAAKEPPIDLVLDMTEALMSYGNYLLRPPLTPAPQFADYAGQSMDRIHGQRMEFCPGREDVRMLLGRRGGRWHGPQLGMLTHKFRELYHLQQCDASALRADASGVSGALAMASVQGDFRYDMHFSGEGSGVNIPEFRNDWILGHGWWPDWWVGPRQRMQPFEQKFALNASQRRGWLLHAKFHETGPVAVGVKSLKGEVFAWIEGGQLRRGYVANLQVTRPKNNEPVPLVEVRGWAAKDKKLEADLHIGVGKNQKTFRVRATLTDGDAGSVAGTVRAASEKGEFDWVASGTLYRAFTGTYETDSVDGKWSRSLLAGVAPVAPAVLPAPAELPTMPAEVFARALDLYRDVAALDWALREYPHPAADALLRLRESEDDRLRLWRMGQHDFPHLPRGNESGDDLHLALAATMGEGNTGAAAYVKALGQIARRTMADRKAGGAAIVGLGMASDPQFAPTTAAGDGQWSLLDNWDCFGFIARAHCMESGPYLPELAMAPGIIPEAGKSVRIAHPNPREHIWRWRGAADPADGAVTVPIECLRVPGEERDNWGHVPQKPGEGLRYLDGAYGPILTWYATTTIQSQRAGRAFVAIRAGWDGRLWVNDTLVWRPSRQHTPHRLAIVPVDLVAGDNRIVACVSPFITGDGNTGKLGPYLYKYGPRTLGSLAVWANAKSQPRSAEAVAAQAQQQKSDAGLAAARAARGLRGRRGDGTGRYPDATPALAWDLEKGHNVRWKTALPTDDAEPVIVGDKLFVTTYDGALACLDAATGKQLWQQTPKADGELALYPAPAIAASFAPSRLWKAGDGAKGFPPTLSTAFPAYARSCLTPIADAQRVWMHDPRGRVACFDHSGKQLWAAAVPAQTPRFVCGGYVEYRVVPPTPPAIIGTRLIAAVGAGLAGYDIDKGTELWRRDVDYNGRFAVMDLGGPGKSQIVILSSCEVLDAATGRTLVARCAPLMPDSTCEPLIEGRIAYLNACSAAVRFWLDDRGDLRHQLLWDSPTDVRKRRTDQNGGRFNGKPEPDFFGQSTGAFPPTPVLYNGTLFMHLAEPNSIDHGPQNLMRLQSYDAATGCAVAQRYGLLMNAMRPGSATVMAGGYLFMADEGCDIGGHFDDFPKNVPMVAITTAEDQPRRISESRGLATLSPPTFAGRRMYMAGSDQVVCIERPESLGQKLSDCELAALKTVFFTREIGRQPTKSSEQDIAPPANLAVADGVPVARLESGKTPGPWLYAGPFFIDEKADIFAAQGGAGAARPAPGQAVSYTKTDGTAATATFVALSDKGGPEAKGADRKTIDRAYALALGNPRYEGGINFAAAAGRQYHTTSYVYTVLDVPEAGAYRVEIHHGRVKSTDVYLGGVKVASEMVVRLARGRYPLMVRAAIAACGNWEPIQFAVQFRALITSKDGPPEALAALPAGTHATVSPLVVNAGLPPVVLGAWPVPEDTAAEALAGQIVTEGVKIGGVEFRRVTAEAMVAGKTVMDRNAYNAPQPFVGYALSSQELFGDRRPGRGLFSAVLENRRAMFVECECPRGFRLWLNGREVRDGQAFSLAPGYYAVLVELRATAQDAPSLPPTFREVSSRATEAERWRDRVMRSADMLKRIAASGPNGAYAQEALDAIAEPRR